jgi:hypothetical protein
VGAVQARADAEQAIAQRDRMAAENEALRAWNKQLAEELALQLGQLHQLDVSASPREPVQSSMLSASPSKSVADLAAQQQQALDAVAAGIKLTRMRAELRAAQEAHAQLQQSAQALAADFSAATRQIGKLEERILQQSQVASELEAMKVAHAAQKAALEQSELRRRDAEVCALLSCLSASATHTQPTRELAAPTCELPRELRV